MHSRLAQDLWGKEKKRKEKRKKNQQNKKLENLDV